MVSNKGGALKSLTFDCKPVHQNKVYNIMTTVNYCLRIVPLWHPKKKNLNEMYLYSVLPHVKTLLVCNEKVIGIIFLVIVSIFIF